MSRDVRIAIDVGGTFTDVVALDPRTGSMRFEKVATTPADPKRGVLDAFARADADLETVAMFNHGTTLGLNSLLTRTGARTAVVGTRGFRDVYLLGRTDRRAMYDITYRKPEPLLLRRDTFEVTERSLYDGTVVTALDEDDAREVAQALAEGEYEAVAIAFLHAYANPAHEQRMREIIADVAPGIEITVSHELSREYREYERTSTAVLDAYIKPTVRRYVTELADQLDRDGFQGRFLMSRSGGGAMTAAAAAEQPVNLILSGPAGGVVGAAGLSRELDLPNLITIDMGGTSLDASLVLDHEPVMHQGAEFEGLPINTPSLYIHTIGSGGGSIVSTDAAGALEVGPRSAGADPGPAAYALGGTQPTFTDAALVLGYLGADLPLGGDLKLNTDLATAAMRAVADELGMDVRELAQGVIRITNTKITGAVRAITVEMGRDPQEFALLSFGGAGGLVAVDVARELNVPTVVVPPGQGAFSALGMLMADVQHDFARTSVVAIDDTDPEFFASAFAAMEAEAAIALEAEGFSAERRRLQRTVDVRYQGQEHSATVPFPDDDAQTPVRILTEEFHRLHHRLYGHTMEDPVEVTTLRLRAVGLVDKPSLPNAPQRTSGAPEPLSHREVLVASGTASYAVYARESLYAGDAIAGPAIIAEYTATTVLHQGDTLTVGQHGELVISIRSEGSAS